MSVEQIDKEQPTKKEDEFLQKFGYRKYHGDRNSRFMRILHGIWFEVRSTWDKSTFGKVLLIFVIFTNAITIIITASIRTSGQPEEQIRNGLNRFIANYMIFSNSPVQPGIESPAFDLSVQIGILLIALFGIAGSGLFADDKQGKVIEVYLSRTDKSTYVITKIGSIIVYTNLFLTLPLIITGALSAQSYGVNHLEYLDYYIGIILFSFLTSVILGLGILSFSIMLDKRNYASLGFFLIYILGTIFGSVIYNLDPSNELLLLVSPEIFLQLLAYVCLGDFQLGLGFGGFFDPSFEYDPLVLNDGIGLEYWHILGVALMYIAVLSSILAYKIMRMTTEEL